MTSFSQGFGMDDGTDVARSDESADNSPLDAFLNEEARSTPLDPPGSAVPELNAVVTEEASRARLEPDRVNANAGRIARTLDELRQMGELIYKGYSRLDDICHDTEQRSRKLLDTLDAIELRIDPLEEVRDLTKAADARLASVRQIVEDFGHRASEFQVQREAIDRGLVEASRAYWLVSDIERRLIGLAAPQVALEQAEARVTSVEQRSEQAVADLTSHISQLDAQRQAIDALLAAAARDAAALAAQVEVLASPGQGLNQAETRINSVERRIEQAFAEITSSASELDVRRESIDSALAATTRTAAALDEQATALMRPTHALQQAAAQLEELERGSKQTLEDLSTFVTTLGAQRDAIESSLTTAARAAAALGVRVEALIGPEQGVSQAETRIASAEHRIEQASADITARMSELDLRSESIQLSLTAATRTAEALDERIATLTGPEHPLQLAANAFEELEQRSKQTLVDFSARVTGLSAERETIESQLADAEQQAHALGERLSVLTAPDQALSKATDQVDAIGNRTAHALTELGVLEARLAHLDVKHEAVDAALTASVRGADALEQRVATLAAPGHPLRQATVRLEELEHQSTRTLDHLATRATELDAKGRAIEQVLADATQQTQALDDRLGSLVIPDEAVRQAQARVDDIEQHAADLVTTLATRVSELGAKGHAIETALAETDRTSSALQARVAAIAAPDSPLRQASSSVEDLEKHAVAAIDLGTRATALTAECQDVEAILAQAERAQTMISDAEARLAVLTKEDELRRVEMMVADLERRAAAAAAQVQRAVAKSDALEPALAKTQRQAQELEETAQRDLERLATASKRAARVANGSVPFWRLVALSAVAVLVVLSIIMLRAKTQPASPSNTTASLLTDAARSSPAAAANTERTRPTAPAGQTREAAAPNAPAASRPQPAKPAEVSRTSPQPRVAATPAAARPVAQSPRQVPSTATPATTTRNAAPAASQFVGDLEVSSEPSGAAVYIDARPVGETPLVLQKIAAGSHVLWVVRDGYARWSRGVLVPANQRTRVSAPLQPAR